MAKQKSLIKITGKSDGQSFYYSKLGGYQMRKIDPNISERVKTDPRFVNTRYAASEFKGCAKTASALVRTIAERWRFFTNSQMVADMTKKFISSLWMDVADPFGRRSVPQALFSSFQDYWNAKQKNTPPPFMVSWLQDKVTWNDSTSKVNFNSALIMTEDFNRQLMAQGATHVTVSLYNFRVTKSHYSADFRDWLDAVSYISNTPIATTTQTLTEEGGQTIVPASTPSVERAPQNSNLIIGGLLLMVFPKKRVNDTVTILQRLCSCYWFSVPDM